MIGRRSDERVARAEGKGPDGWLFRAGRMIRLNILAGRSAGSGYLGKRFPLVLGRGTGADLILDDPGVWDCHATLDLDRLGRFQLRAESGAMVVVNGVALPKAELKNGDVLDLGGARLRFSLSETRLRSHRAREWATWVGVVLLCLGQVLLIYLVMP